MKANRKQGLIDVFKNAVKARTLNKSITITKTKKDSNTLSFVRMIEKGESSKTACSISFSVKEKVKVTQLILSDEGIDTLYQSLKQYIEHVKQ